MFDFSNLCDTIFRAALSSDVWCTLGQWDPARSERRPVGGRK